MQISIPADKSWRKQFVITPGLGASIAGTTTIPLAGSELHCFDGVPTTKVDDATGRTIGILVGYAVDLDRKELCGSELSIALPGGNPSSRIRALEERIYSLGGRWLFLCDDAPNRRVYLDANGANSLVFSAEHRCAASTTGLLLDDEEYRGRLDAELYRFLEIDVAGWFPSGLTAHRGVKRLLCNHYLDLNDWTVHRHWPHEDFAWAADTRSHALRIAKIARDTVEAFTKSGSVACSLTAGNETRFLLAALREHASKIRFVTVRGEHAKIDVHHARKLAVRFSLNHLCLARQGASNEQVRRWRYAAGHCVGGANMYWHPSIRPLADHAFFVGGLGGEIGRAFLWRPEDDESTHHSPRSIAGRFGIPIHRRVLEATEEWLRGVQNFNGLTQLDLAYLELRMSAWAFAQAYAQDAIVDHVHPMISRESYRLMLELSPEAKRGNAFVTEAIHALWPELLDLPINRYGDFRDWLEVARKFGDPKRVVRKLRKLAR